MEGNYHQDISWDEMARSINLSRSHFFHLFKRETDTTPVRRLKSIRMRKAKELLESSFLTVKEVMARVGFKDESHFVRDFGKVYGLSPSGYRASFLASKKIDAASTNPESAIALSANK
jgi:transcriptional regulator GlxA family with amidase domain